MIPKTRGRIRYVKLFHKYEFVVISSLIQNWANVFVSYQGWQEFSPLTPQRIYPTNKTLPHTNIHYSLEKKNPIVFLSSNLIFYPIELCSKDIFPAEKILSIKVRGECLICRKNLFGGGVQGEHLVTVFSSIKLYICFDMRASQCITDRWPWR